ncbi:hypothetical protein J2W42_004750 [Rhizobium tibeticum]|uniref:Uncharacterized protein n=1 Tax=Rhizobium tibeticum TaxID=501024 RepID=A0A1H8LLY0_9HYPH|nr:hypothetical protein [Rhizobium tibeticum]SEH90558.1 hypothetical protein RTCCBAU85039_2983 [Rhizobium tibeticum]SEO06089.1 hypothetical protein SAMN05216228_101156 [Rhizobium tibeticum]
MSFFDYISGVGKTIHGIINQQIHHQSIVDLASRVPTTARAPVSTNKLIAYWYCYYRADKAQTMTIGMHFDAIVKI